LGTAAQINDITTNLGGALVDVHCEFTPLGQGRVGQLRLFIWVTKNPHHFVQWVGDNSFDLDTNPTRKFVEDLKRI